MLACLHCGKGIGFIPAHGEASVICPHCNRRTRIAMPDERVQPPPLPTNASAQTRIHSDKQIIADVVGGLNLRVKDNLYQGIAILLFVIVGAALGFYLAGGTTDGALFGAAAGLIAGFLASGFFLMIYRIFKHD